MDTSDAMFYCFLFFLWIISSILVRSFVNNRWSNRTDTVRHPPSPPALPIIGHLHLLISSNVPNSFQTLARRYGPLIQLRLGTSLTFTLVSSFTVAKDILKTHDSDFPTRATVFTSGYNIYKGSTFINAPYGTYWRYLKKLCMNELLSSSQINRSIHIREEEILKLLESLMKNSKKGEFCDLSMVLTAMTNNVICRMAMSTRCSENDDEAKEIKKIVRDVFELGRMLGVNKMMGPLGKFDIFGYEKKLGLAMGQFDRLVERIMKEHEEKEKRGCEGEGRDLMDIMLESYKDTNAEVKLTRNDVKAFFLEIFLAGTDTSSVAMQWAMAELINHPQAFKKLREEIDSIVGSNRLVKESDVPNLPYLRATVKETLRLHTPGPILFRECTNDCSINGYDFKKSKSLLVINSYAIMRDPNAWTDPDEFIPERFLVNSNSTENLGQHHMEIKGQDFRHLPFGGGRRGCPGASLASTVMQATIGALVQCFDWKVKGGEKVDLKSGSGLLATAMAHPLLCYPITHFNPF
ncbi:hypothetical protein L1049_008514 [Liquidambar formosana]|uniref:Cytochrome P450 n=1 Tax=Liquidambar formosana TaxID=63359 RepID=A0AAP0X5N7_LIQFO